MLGFETDGAAVCRRIHDCGQVAVSELVEDAEAPLLKAVSEYLPEVGCNFEHLELSAALALPVDEVLLY